MTNSKPNGSSSDLQDILRTANLEADIAQLNALLSSEIPKDDTDADVNISELLERLESANGVASGVENKLDDVLSKLDGLIASLESGDGGTSGTLEGNGEQDGPQKKAIN